jgi:hypothetical protein
LHDIKLALRVPENGTLSAIFISTPACGIWQEAAIRKFFGGPDPSEFTAYSNRVSGLGTESQKLNACTRRSS